MEASKQLFRCSRLGALMTESKTKNELSETTKSYLLEVMIYDRFKIRKDISTAAINKGLQVEEQAITLYSLNKMKMYRKNEITLKNDFIIGTPDLFEGEDIQLATKIIDTKSSWDIFTFFKSKHDKINKDYYWQLQGYMALTGATESSIAYCLIDTPETIVNDEKRRLLWNMGTTDETDEVYESACREIERRHKYSNIMGEQERLHEVVIERDNEAIERLYERIEQCRKYLKTLS